MAESLGGAPSDSGSRENKAGEGYSRWGCGQRDGVSSFSVIHSRVLLLGSRERSGPVWTQDVASDPLPHAAAGECPLSFPAITWSLPQVLGPRGLSHCGL